MSQAAKAARLVHIVLDVACGRATSIDDLALDCGVSRRTLQRDLLYLRKNRIHVDIEEGGLALSSDAREEVRRWMGLGFGFAVP